MPPAGCSWHPVDSPVTLGWWELRLAGERIALVQPFEGRAHVNVYPGGQPWKNRGGPAGTVAQGKRFAERWAHAQVKLGTLAR